MHNYGDLPLIGLIIKALLILLPSAFVLILISFLALALLNMIGLRHAINKKKLSLLIASIFIAAFIVTVTWADEDVNTVYGFLILSSVIPVTLATGYLRLSFLKVFMVIVISAILSFYVTERVVFFVHDYWTYGGYPSFLSDLIVGNS